MYQKGKKKSDSWKEEKKNTFWASFMKRSFALCPLRSALKNNNRAHYLAVCL